MTAEPLSPEQLEAALKQIGAERYHSLHPFHKLMYQGKLNRGQLQAWALNRYYYQCRIPAKDATLIARLPTAELRRAWRRRLHDHDGDEPNSGGIERWLRLTDGLGLDRDYVISTYKGCCRLPDLPSMPMSTLCVTDQFWRVSAPA